MLARLEEAEQDVGVDGALVRFVQDDDAVRAHGLVQQTLTQQHAVRHIFDHRLRPGAVLETDRIAHLLAQAASDLQTCYVCRLCAELMQRCLQRECSNTLHEELMTTQT